MIRDRAKVAHQLHKLAVVGSSPAPVPRRGVDLFQKNHNQKTESALCSTLVATQPTYNRGLTSSFLFNGNCRHTGLSHMAVRTAKRFSWRQESGQQCPPCKPDAKERDIAAHATSLYAVSHKKMARDELSPRNALGRNRGDGGRVKILPLFNRGLAKPDRPTFCGKTASLQPRAVIQTFACAILFTVAPEILHAPSFSPWRPKATALRKSALPQGEATHNHLSTPPNSRQRCIARVHKYWGAGPYITQKGNRYAFAP